MTIRVLRDESPESPRENDNLGEMVCWHGGYTLGDKQPTESSTEYRESIPEGSIVLPVYLYDHSGITVRTTPFHCQWDSGQVGLIIATPEKLREEYGAGWNTEETRALATGVLEGEVKEYDDFITGNSWGFEQLDADGEVENACWGFLGDDPFTNGMSEHFEESEHAELAKVADEAGMSPSYVAPAPEVPAAETAAPRKPRR